MKNAGLFRYRMQEIPRSFIPLTPVKGVYFVCMLRKSKNINSASFQACISRREDGAKLIFVGKTDVALAQFTDGRSTVTIMLQLLIKKHR